MTLNEVAPATVRAAGLEESASADATPVVVSIFGDADVLSLSAVIDNLVRAVAHSDGPVVVDLARTKFIDAGTMRALGRASLLLEGRGRTLTLRSPSKLAIRVLELLDLSHLVESGSP